MVKEIFDRKILQVGSARPSRYLNVTRILPPDWRYVRIHKPEIQGDTAILKIECLYKNSKTKEEK